MAVPYRFLTGYQGGKQFWVGKIPELEGRHITELFAGSAVLSANYAASAVLVDTDPMICRIIERFDEQIVPEAFSREDFYRVRGREDWWRWAYCLSASSFSALFRYSKNGFNVAHRNGPLGVPPKSLTYEVRHLRPEYEASLARWRQLQPKVINASYLELSDDDIASGRENVVVVCDPPYRGSQTAYNKGFDYDRYWARVRELAQKFDLVIFDRVGNLEAAGFTPTATQRPMTFNGAHSQDIEGVAIVRRGSAPQPPRTSQV